MITCQKHFVKKKIFTPFVPEEVVSLIFRVTKSFSPELHEVDGRALRPVAHILVEPLCYFINESFLSGEFPAALKKPKCILVYKNKGSKYLTENYRCLRSKLIW